jgi:hypothetical protein
MEAEHLLIVFLLVVVAGFARRGGMPVGVRAPIVSAEAVAEPQSIEAYIAKNYGG